MSIEDALSALDLNKTERLVYIKLLESGETLVSKLVKQVSLKRPTIYAALNSLESKGFASRTIRGKRMLFSPLHPQKLVTEAEIRLKELKAVVPQLESLMHSAGDRPRFTVFEGKESLDKAYDDWFSTKGEILYLSNIAISQEVFPRTFSKIDYISPSSEFSIRELIDPSEHSKKYAQKYRGPHRQIRFIPNEFLPIQGDIGVFGNMTLITSVKKEYFTVKIESDDIARVFRMLYEALWRISAE